MGIKSIHISLFLLAANLAIDDLVYKNGLLYVVSLIYRLNQSKVYIWIKYCFSVASNLHENSCFEIRHGIVKCLFWDNEDKRYFAEIEKNVRK